MIDKTNGNHFLFRYLLSKQKDIGRLLYLCYALSIRDFRQRYQGTYLGLVWVVAQPLSFLIVIATVVHFGLRGTDNSNIPYLVFLATAFIPWLFFSSTCTQLTGVFKKYSYVVKNVSMPTVTLFIGVFFSNIYVHGLLVVVLVVLAAFYGFSPDIVYLQLLYYFFACSVFVFAVGLITASVFIFFRDLEKVISVLLQFGFWLTPILWDKNKLPDNLMWAVNLNPIYYIVSGYRDTILYQVPFFEAVWQGVYFWGLTLIILVIGIFLFRRLSPHFIEVL